MCQFLCSGSGEGLNGIKSSLESVSGGKILLLQTPGLAGVWTLGSFTCIHPSVPEYTHLSLSHSSFQLCPASSKGASEICTFLTRSECLAQSTPLLLMNPNNPGIWTATSHPQPPGRGDRIQPSFEGQPQAVCSRTSDEGDCRLDSGRRISQPHLREPASVLSAYSTPKSEIPSPPSLSLGQDPVVRSWAQEVEGWREDCQELEERL